MIQINIHIHMSHIHNEYLKFYTGYRRSHEENDEFIINQILKYETLRESFNIWYFNFRLEK